MLQFSSLLLKGSIVRCNLQISIVRTNGDGKDHKRTSDQYDDRKNTSDHEKEAAIMEDDEVDSKVYYGSQCTDYLLQNLRRWWRTLHPQCSSSERKKNMNPIVIHLGIFGRTLSSPLFFQHN
ncbi:hypothetical protein L6452_43518 [Arctium lappa]|uniref:Uncharacterized protein n=1 Tax=Arctium lappa TaxID=4217 RepID=A0ACB8XDL6_ARCLA|nr:hypothetical protein L6452_43518 [Arctium lappa]